MRRSVIVFTLLLLLAGCGGGGQPKPVGKGKGFIELQQVVGGEADDQTVTVVGAYYERAHVPLLVRALSLEAPGGPVPLLSSPSEAVALSRLIGGSFNELNGVRYGVIQITGKVSKIEGQRGIEVAESKVVEPLQIELDVLPGSGFDGATVSVRGALLRKAGALLLVSKLGAGGVPEERATQVKLVTPLEDESLISQLNTTGDGSISFGEVEAVGIWLNQSLQVFWAKPV